MGLSTGFLRLKDDGDGDEDEEDGGDEVDQWFEVLEDYIDSIWILKVFGSYGLMIPAIITSLLLATGPKTFLMALAIPLAQSTLSFAVQRTLNKGNNKKRRKAKMRKGRRPKKSSRGVRFEQESWRERKKSYPIWLRKDDDSSGNRFGGWDELDEGTEEAPKKDESRKRNAENGNREIEDDGPLLPILELLGLVCLVGPWMDRIEQIMMYVMAENRLSWRYSIKDIESSLSNYQKKLLLYYTGNSCSWRQPQIARKPTIEIVEEAIFMHKGRTF